MALSPEAAYDEGVAAFESGRFAQALDRLLAARAGGIDDPQLHYNLGSAYYRLGRFSEAHDAFMRATESPGIAPLAWYNLALTAASLHDTDQAQAWLTLVLETGDQDTLHELANALRQRLDDGSFAGAGGMPAQPDPAWNGFLNTGLGHDSNVLLLSDPDLLGGTDRDDFFIDLFGHLGHDTWRDDTGNYTVGIEASAWLLRHLRINDYDMSALRAGTAIEHAGAVWTTGGGAHLAWTTLDSRAFTRETLLNLRAGRGMESGRFRLRYELGKIEAIRSDYRYLDGLRHRIETRISRLQDGTRMHLQYQLEINDRSDLDSPLFASASPLRNSISVAVDAPLGQRLELRTELQFMHSRFRDPNELPGGDRITRTDRRVGIYGGLAWEMPEGGELTIEYRYTDNSSAIPVYAYERHRLMAGVLLIF